MLSKTVLTPIPDRSLWNWHHRQGGKDQVAEPCAGSPSACSFALQTELAHELGETPTQDQVAAPRPHGLRRDPRQQKPGEVPVGELAESSRTHHQRVRTIAGDVLFPPSGMGPGKGAKCQHPHHETEVWFRLMPRPGDRLGGRV